MKREHASYKPSNPSLFFFFVFHILCGFVYLSLSLSFYFSISLSRSLSLAIEMSLNESHACIHTPAQIQFTLQTSCGDKGACACVCVCPSFLPTVHVVAGLSESLWGKNDLNGNDSNLNSISEQEMSHHHHFAVGASQTTHPIYYIVHINTCRLRT